MATRTAEDLKRSGEGLAAVVSDFLRHRPGHPVARLKSVDTGTAYRLELWFRHGTDAEEQKRFAQEVNLWVYTQSVRRPWMVRLCPIGIEAKEIPA